MRTARSSGHPWGGGLHQAPWDQAPPRTRHPPFEQNDWQTGVKT